MHNGSDFFTQAAAIASEAKWDWEATAHSRRKIIRVKPADWRRAAQQLQACGGNNLLFLTGTEDRHGLQLVADIRCDAGDTISLRAAASTGAVFPSLHIFWSQADWHEEEVRRVYGIQIGGEL